MNNESTNKNKRRTARILTVACGLLFSIFCLVYLGVFQKDVVKALHYSLAQGKTVYEPCISAILVTIVLLIFRWGMNSLIHLKGSLYALSYFPSFLLLGVLTDVGHGVYHGGGISSVWSWLLPLLLVAFIVLGYLFGRVFHVGMNPGLSEGTVVNSNIFILLMLCFMTVGLGNTNIHFHHELQIEEALNRQDYVEARKVGEKSMDPSRNLTALRAYAMSREGTMGEYLFQYPQLYGASGLLMGVSNEKALRLNADSLYVYLGNRPELGESSIAFFRRICEEESGNYTTLDYYLSALLLERKLEDFVQSFNALYTIKDSIPYYYKQALFLYDKMNPSDTNGMKDDFLEELWSRYGEKKKEFSEQLGEANKMRREFGCTYWWYYQYR